MKREKHKNKIEKPAYQKEFINQDLADIGDSFSDMIELYTMLPPVTCGPKSDGINKTQKNVGKLKFLLKLKNFFLKIVTDRDKA